MVATITNPTRGYSIIVSGAGDFTNRIIAEPPRYLWVSGIPTYGMLGVAPLFQSVLLIATGPGIGPRLSIILARKVPCHMPWITSNSEKEITESILANRLSATIHNTREKRRPDTPVMVLEIWEKTGAGAVCVVSNKENY
jgi:hypothetical protein